MADNDGDVRCGDLPNDLTKELSNEINLIQEREPEKNETPVQKLSKRQLRKMKKKENCLKYRAEKRLKERNRKKERRQQLRERGVDLGPSKKQLKRNTMASSACKIRVAVDCSYDKLMTEKDIMKLTQQLNHAYSANRRAADPLQYYVTGLSGKTKERMESIGDYKSWDVHFHEKEYLSVFPKEEVVYLSSESDNVLQTLEPGKVYIIGGLVDHNFHKGLCYKLAQEKCISHAQLPIGQYLNMKSRKVLTINHVFEILLYFTESGDWEDSIYRVLPKRKGAEPKALTSTATSSKTTIGEDDIKSCDNICDKDSDDEHSEEGKTPKNSNEYRDIASKSNEEEEQS